MTEINRLDELNILIRANYRIIYILSWEEQRVLKLLQQVAEERRKNLCSWSLTDGIVSLDGYDGSPVDPGTRNPIRALDFIAASTEPAIFALKDFHPFLDIAHPTNDHTVVVRTLRDLSNELKRARKTLVILSPLLAFPPELENDITVLDYSLPTSDELAQALDRVIRSARELGSKKIQVDPENREKVLAAAQGLTCPSPTRISSQKIASQMT